MLRRAYVILGKQWCRSSLTFWKLWKQGIVVKYRLKYYVNWNELNYIPPKITVIIGFLMISWEIRINQLIQIHLILEAKVGNEL